MKTVTGWIVTNDEYDILQQTVEYNQRHDWMQNIVILHGDAESPSHFGKLSKRFPKVIEEWQPFGGRGSNPKAKFELSFVPSVEEGGWNELEHRNSCLGLAEDCGAEYLLAIDTDEVFDESSVELLEHNPSVAFFEFNTWIYTNAIKKYPVSYPNGLTRVHPRVWKNNLGIKYLAHGTAIPNYQNQTIHVWPSITRYHTNSASISTPGDFRLQHLHMMFKSKRDANYNNYPKEKVTIVDYKWDEYFTKMFASERTNKKFGEKITIGIK